MKHQLFIGAVPTGTATVVLPTAVTTVPNDMSLGSRLFLTLGMLFTVLGAYAGVLAGK